jgi:hypothetical protein
MYHLLRSVRKLSCKNNFPNACIVRNISVKANADFKSGVNGQRAIESIVDKIVHEQQEFTENKFKKFHKSYLNEKNKIGKNDIIVQYHLDKLKINSVCIIVPLIYFETLGQSEFWSFMNIYCVVLTLYNCAILISRLLSIFCNKLLNNYNKKELQYKENIITLIEKTKKQ